VITAVKNLGFLKMQKISGLAEERKGCHKELCFIALFDWFGGCLVTWFTGWQIEIFRIDMEKEKVEFKYSASCCRSTEMPLNSPHTHTHTHTHTICFMHATCSAVVFCEINSSVSKASPKAAMTALFSQSMYVSVLPSPTVTAFKL
jgi:hypothetical protein